MWVDSPLHMHLYSFGALLTYLHIVPVTFSSHQTLAYLKSPDQFGRFGKILKLFFSRRAAIPGPPIPGAPVPSSSAGPYVPVNVYINYSSAAEANACIAAIDGTVTPDGHKLKATWGTTRYCPAYLRGVRCTNENCMQAHEPGEELESGTHPGGSERPPHLHHQASSSSYHNSYGHHGNAHASSSARDRHPEGVRETRDEMVNLKHAYKEQAAKEPALPPTASWASKPSATGLHSHPSSSDLRRTSSSSPSTSHRPTPSNAAPSASASTSSHAHSSSISSRLPKAQNHPLPPRPPSRTASADLARTKSLKEKEKESAPAIEKAKAPLSDRTATPPQATATQSNAREAPSTSAVAQAATNVIAPPTPPVSEPSSTASTSQKPTLSAFPPGIPIPSGRPLTPVSEFERTLDTFGDGSFAFNLSASNNASPFGVKGKERLSMNADKSDGADDEERTQMRFDPDAESAQSNAQASRDGSPSRSTGSRLASLHAYSDVDASETEDPSRSSYQGPFDPFALPGESNSTPSKTSVTGDSVSRSGSPFISGMHNGKMEGPPGLSRVNTGTSSQDGTGAAPGHIRGGPPPGLEEASRHRSRFGFARPGSTERVPGASVGMSQGGGGSGSGISISVTDLFKGINGAPGLNGALNGGMSPIRPGSAQSGASGFVSQPPPGIFSPSILNGHSSASASSGSTSSLPLASASNAPLPPASTSTHQDAGSSSPSKQKKSLADLFPGVDLAASFSASSALPDALVKSLGISLENLDLQASAAANGKLPTFAPLPLGQTSGLANLPLPPKSSSGQQQQASAGTSSASSPIPPHQGANGGPVLSHGAMPPGLGTSRQAQQAHAQNAQQAHQAHLAAQQAQAQAAAAVHQQQTPGQHMMGHYGRPPSAASAGSKHSADVMFSAANASPYSKMQNATSPPGMPGTPGSYGDVSSGRFQDPAIVSFAGLNGFAQQHMHHNPYGSPYGLHGVLEQASPGSTPVQSGPVGSGVLGQAQAGGDFYNRYHPLPTPVQPQQPYNPYIPVGPVGMNGIPANAVGMNRLQAGQPMSPGGGFGMLRR